MKSSSKTPSTQTPSQSSQPTTPTDPQTDLQTLNKSQRIWFWIYIVWILGNIYTYIPTLRIGSPEFKEALTSFYFPVLVLNVIIPLLAAAPYWIQLYGIIRKSLKATNIGVKIMYLYGFVWAVLVIIAWVGYFFHDKIQALFGGEGSSDNFVDGPGFYDAGDIPKLAKESITGLVNFVAGYIISKKYKGFLAQIENLPKKKKD